MSGHYRVRGPRGGFVGGEWATYADAARWARQYAPSRWTIVEVDRYGNELATRESPGPEPVRVVPHT